jgi:hypothetical protein
MGSQPVEYASPHQQQQQVHLTWRCREHLHNPQVLFKIHSRTNAKHEHDGHVNHLGTWTLRIFPDILTYQDLSDLSWN